MKVQNFRLTFIITLIVMQMLKGQTIEQIADDLSAPSISYMMVAQDKIIASHINGYENIEEERLADLESQYAIYSITKTFTSIAIFQLQERGELSIYDAVKDYLPQYEYLENISIRDLLTHQSGINNPIPLKWTHLAKETDFDYRAFSHQVLLEKAKVKKSKQQKSIYSNLNYLLLGEIIETITGLDYRTYVEQNILKDNTQIGFQWNKENAATGYFKNKGIGAMLLGLLIDKKAYTYKVNKDYLGFIPNYVNGLPYGGLLANSEGIKDYLQLLLKTEHSLINSESKSELFQEQLLVNGQSSGKALGWFTGQLDGTPYVCHAGGGGGFYSEIRIYPDLGLASFIMMNESGFKDQRLLDNFDKSTFTQMNFNEQREVNIVSIKDGNNSLNTRVYSADKEETIILLHGGPGVPDDMLELVDQLKGKYRVITFDQRGSGGSVCKGDDYSIPAYLDDVNRVANHFGVDRFHLFGHSWGGLYAQIYAQAYPQKIQSLFLCSPSSGTGEQWKQTEREVMQFNKAACSSGEWLKMGFRSFKGMLGSSRAYQKLFTQVIKNYHQSFDVSNLQTSSIHKINAKPINKTRENILEYPKLDRLENPSFPIMVIYGESDIYGESKQHVFDRYPTAKVETIEKSGHIPWLQSPRVFGQILARFYQYIAPTGQSM